MKKALVVIGLVGGGFFGIFLASALMQDGMAFAVIAITGAAGGALLLPRLYKAVNR
jgi:hypothetical protein